MKMSKSELLAIEDSLPQFELDQVYESVADAHNLKSLYKNIHERVYDDDAMDYCSFDDQLEDIIFVNRELYIDDDGVKVVRSYHSDLDANLVTPMKVKLFLHGFIYQKDFHSREQLIECLNSNKFVQQKWTLVN